MDIRAAELLGRAAGLATASLVRNWMGTMQFEYVLLGGTRTDSASPHFERPVIYLVWHEYMLMPLYTRGFTGMKMLVSRHQDAEWLAQAGLFLGYEGIRGSTGRNAVAAMRQLMRDGQQFSLAITPDGPRGPRRSVTSGAVFLASKLQLPICCTGVGFERPWRVNRSWDKFAIPRPFSRARMILTDHIYVPKKLGRVGLQNYSEYFRSTLENVTTAAEEWADSGRRMTGAAILRRGPQRLHGDDSEDAVASPLRVFRDADEKAA